MKEKAKLTKVENWPRVKIVIKRAGEKQRNILARNCFVFK